MHGMPDVANLSRPNYQRYRNADFEAKRRGTADTPTKYLCTTGVRFASATRLPQSATYCTPSRQIDHWASISVATGCETASSVSERRHISFRDRRGVKHIWQVATCGVTPLGMARSDDRGMATVVAGKQEVMNT